MTGEVPVVGNHSPQGPYTPGGVLWNAHGQRVWLVHASWNSTAVVTGVYKRASARKCGTHACVQYLFRCDNDGTPVELVHARAGHVGTPASVWLVPVVGTPGSVPGVGTLGASTCSWTAPAVLWLVPVVGTQGLVPEVGTLGASTCSWTAHALSLYMPVHQSAPVNSGSIGQTAGASEARTRLNCLLFDSLICHIYRSVTS